MLFSALVPITMSALNWGRVGRTRERNLWLTLGFAGSVLLFWLLSALPRSVALPGQLGASAGIAYYLRDRQHPLFEGGLRLGAGRSATWKAVLVGVGLTLGALAIVIFGSMAIDNLRFQPAIKLIEQERFAEAAVVLEKILRDHPDDAAATASLALCRLYEGRWDEAARGFDRYLSMPHADSAVAYANLALAATARGQGIEADSLAARARALEPAVFSSLYGSDDLKATLDSIAQHAR
jgi:tetratricopeptide (TPR) repeat protein